MTSLYFTDEEKSVLVFKYHYPHLINWAVFLAILPKLFAVHLPIYSKLTKKKINFSDLLSVRENCIYYEIIASSPGGENTRKYHLFAGTQKQNSME